MKIYHSPDVLGHESIVLLGTFDGIHKGHQTLAKRAFEISQNTGLQSVMYTFDVNPISDKRRLMSDKQRVRLCEQAGIDSVYIEKFDSEFKKMMPDEFIQKILIERLKAKAVVVGSNFRFGYNHAGTLQMLQNNGFDLHVLPEYAIEGQVVSSSAIRALIEEGNVKKAYDMLGYHYALRGIVVHGRAVGRSMGVKTANIDIDNSFVLPADGVYVTVIYIDGMPYKSITNIGVKPTFKLQERTIETHVPGFDGDLYGMQVELEFVDFVRKEKAFSSAEALVLQIDEDIKHMDNILRGDVFGQDNKKD